MNKIFRENIDFLLERFENGDLCGVVVRMFYFCLYNLIAAAGKLLFWNHFFFCLLKLGTATTVGYFGAYTSINIKIS